MSFLHTSHSIMLRTWHTRVTGDILCIEIYSRFIRFLSSPSWAAAAGAVSSHKQHKRDTKLVRNEMKEKSRLDFYRHSTRHTSMWKFYREFDCWNSSEMVISSYWFGKHNDIWFYAPMSVCVYVFHIYKSDHVFVCQPPLGHHVQYKIYWYECDVCRKSSGIPALIPPGESVQREENHLFNRFLFLLSHSVAFHNHLHIEKKEENPFLAILYMMMMMMCHLCYRNLKFHRDILDIMNTSLCHQK